MGYGFKEQDLEEKIKKHDEVIRHINSFNDLRAIIEPFYSIRYQLKMPKLAYKKLSKSKKIKIWGSSIVADVGKTVLYSYALYKLYEHFVK